MTRALCEYPSLLRIQVGHVIICSVCELSLQYAQDVALHGAFLAHEHKISYTVNSSVFHDAMNDMVTCLSHD